MHNRVLLAGLLALCLTGSPAAVAQISKALVNASGVNLLARNVSNQVSRALSARGAQPPGADLSALFMAELHARVDDAVARSAEQWFTSPPARQLADVERAAAARASVEELRAVMATLQGIPDEEGDLLARLRRATRALEINLVIARYGYAAVLAGTENLAPAAALERAGAELAPSRDFQMQQLRATQTYVYGDASTEALKAYIQWAETPHGSSWFGAVQTALETALEHWLATPPASAATAPVAVQDQ